MPCLKTLVSISNGFKFSAIFLPVLWRWNVWTTAHWVIALKRPRQPNNEAVLTKKRLEDFTIGTLQNCGLGVALSAIYRELKVSMETHFGGKIPCLKTLAIVYAVCCYDDLLQKIKCEIGDSSFYVIHDETQYPGKKYNAIFIGILKGMQVKQPDANRHWISLKVFGESWAYSFQQQPKFVRKWWNRKSSNVLDFFSVFEFVVG